MFLNDHVDIKYIKKYRKKKFKYIFIKICIYSNLHTFNLLQVLIKYMCIWYYGNF